VVAWLLQCVQLTVLKRRTNLSVPADRPPQQKPTPSTTSQTDHPSPPHPLLSINSDDDNDDIEYVGTRTQQQGVPKWETCRQHLVSVPPDQTAIGMYPFMLHVGEHIPWEFASCCGSLLLHAHNCEDRCLDEDGLCRQCRSLLSSDKFIKFLARMQEGVCENTPYKYHELASLAEITRKKEQTIEMYCTQRINNMQKLLGREGAIALHRQILLVMSTGKVLCVDRILCIASERRMSVAAILEMVKKAGQGMYQPKGFKEEEDLADTPVPASRGSASCRDCSLHVWDPCPIHCPLSHHDPTSHMLCILPT
jgi:hypothetical protein